jgi:hypothetical protein
LFVAFAAIVVPVVVPATAAHAADVDPYRGLGAWVDAFDYAPRLQPNGNPPPVIAGTVDDMARLGVRTMYLQVANPDGSPTNQLTDAAQLTEFLTHAHTAGVRIVAWYLPSVVDVAADTQMLKTIMAFRSGTARFDSLALDLEDTTSVTDLSTRNDRIVQLARNARTIIGTRRALGAIVYPAVQTEVLNPLLWPNFPYKRLAASVDVWMPMTYFTLRTDPYRDAFLYTDESVRRLRKDLGDANALVHPIGGIADQTTPEDYVAFIRAARGQKAIGYSVYDFNTTASSAWTFLRAGSLPT